jgi:hypothetical protein
MSNIFYLPTTSSELEPVQLDLFSQELGESSRLDFSDLSKSNHESFLNVLSAKSIRMVMDTRTSVAFPKYYYDHKEIFRYFDKYQVRYDNVSETIKSLESSSISLWSMSHGDEFRQYLQEALNLGSCLVLYDSNANRKSAELFRKLVVSQFGLEHRQVN